MPHKDAWQRWQACQEGCPQPLTVGGARTRPCVQALLAPAAQSAGVEVPLDFYKILQISRVASRENATRAYDRCVDGRSKGRAVPQGPCAF